MSRRVRQWAGGSAAALVLGLALLGGAWASSARGDRASDLQSAIDSKRATEQMLLSGIAADNSKIDRYGGSIAAIQAHLAAVEASLAAAQAQLAATRAQERTERARLVTLQRRLALTDQALGHSLLIAYESPPPDWLTVVFNAHGFADLVERVNFMHRVQKAAADMITTDRRARRQVISEATRLGALGAREQASGRSVLVQRDQIAGLRVALVNRQLIFVRARDRKSGVLQSTAGERRQLEGSLSSLLQAQAAAAQAQAQSQSFAPSSGAAPGAAPAPTSGHVLSGGGFTFPLPSGSASPPGTWSEDAGVDISAPGDTPEYAVGSGTIVLHGIGGFGPWAPVLHLDSPISGQSYVYYGHAGPGGELPVGTHVGAGQVIGSVGPGIVGMSTGPHIEIGFADGSGTPAPGTAGLMDSLLHSAYGG